LFPAHPKILGGFGYNLSIQLKVKSKILSPELTP